MQKQLSICLRDESGATAIEYSLIAALLAIGIIAALIAIGGSLASTFAGLAEVF